MFPTSMSVRVNKYHESRAVAGVMKPLKIHVPGQEVDRYYKIRHTRVPTKDIVPGADNNYGFTTALATELYQMSRS